MPIRKSPAFIDPSCGADHLDGAHNIINNDEKEGFFRFHLRYRSGAKMTAFHPNRSGAESHLLLSRDTGGIAKTRPVRIYSYR
jgi:hypothetical protein